MAITFLELRDTQVAIVHWGYLWNSVLTRCRTRDKGREAFQQSIKLAYKPEQAFRPLENLKDAAFERRMITSSSLLNRAFCICQLSVVPFGNI